MCWCGPIACFGKYGTVNDKHWRLRTGAGVLELKDNKRSRTVGLCPICWYYTAQRSLCKLHKPLLILQLHARNCRHRGYESKHANGCGPLCGIRVQDEVNRMRFGGEKMRGFPRHASVLNIGETLHCVYVFAFL